MKKFLTLLLTLCLFSTMSFTSYANNDSNSVYTTSDTDNKIFIIDFNSSTGSVEIQTEKSSSQQNTSIKESFYNSDSYLRPSSQSVYLDRRYVTPVAYNIKGNNYFKLRDIAYIMNGSAKQFDVTWNSITNSIELISEKSYTVVGGEMEKPSYNPFNPALPTQSEVYLDGQKINLTAYNIGGNNYFKLRDIGKALNFSVEWDAEWDAIRIEPFYEYIEEGIDSFELVRNTGLSSTNQIGALNWAKVSSLQQFKYLDEGLAYAYPNNDTLNIVTLNKTLKLDMKYPLLGDIISDDDGNFYIVWGKENESGSTSEETVFISKYDENGSHIRTTGFVGECRMGERGNTKSPFQFGNCSSAIYDGILMVNYAREMYNGHQSNNVIGVYTNSMSPYRFDSEWDIPYTSHSFNQKVIWSELANGFVYADHGDAYSRAFSITTDEAKLDIFTFYLQSNASYNMQIVNKTFAQLGGLLETDDGVVLVGASVKSINENAKKEKQNLFVQVFDPTATEISKSMFVGGVERKGATSYNINDINNSPLTPVTDYGVQWITNHTDRDVIAPHCVVADDKIVILWSENTEEHTESFYTILKSNGKILKSPTSLGVGRKLNSYEDPIYHNGRIHWACVSNGNIRVDSFSID